jgi:hypothetical protein
MPVRRNSTYYVWAFLVQKHLPSCLPSETSETFTITGSSLANNTPSVKQVEELLSETHRAGTFSSIKQHAPVEQLDEVTEAVCFEEA